MLGETRAKAVPDDAEKITWRGADIARCWIKYGVVLLEASKVGLDSFPPDCIHSKDLNRLFTYLDYPYAIKDLPSAGSFSLITDDWHIIVLIVRCP